MFAEIGDDIMIVTFLSDARTTQKVSRIARYLGCVGRSDLLRAALQALKTKVVAARQAGAAPSPRPSAALTHQSFVNIRTRVLQRGKVRRNSLVLHT